MSATGSFKRTVPGETAERVSMEGASETVDLVRPPSGVETPIFPSFLFLLPLTYIAFDTENSRLPHCFKP